MCELQGVAHTLAMMGSEVALWRSIHQIHEGPSHTRLSGNCTVPAAMLVQGLHTPQWHLQALQG
jgi:hypothetical protein